MLATSRERSRGIIAMISTIGNHNTLYPDAFTTGSTLDMSLFFGTDGEEKQFCYEFLDLLKKKTIRKATKLRNSR
jgi:hypothetical protein